jgi:CBS domain-containing protein
MRVADVMTSPVLTVAPDEPWKQVAERMLDADVSGLPVTNDDGYLMGVVTEADLVSKPAFGTRRHSALAAFTDLLTGDARWAAKATALTAAELMTTAVITASPREDVRIVAQRMLERGVKRLPVVDGGQLVGIISRQDLLRVFDRSDGDITAELTEKLASARYAPDDHEVTVSVADGVVTLDGWVRAEDDVPVVEGLARRISGVVHVVDRVGFHERTRGERNHRW